jgi:GTP cyclohydrolase II
VTDDLIVRHTLSRNDSDLVVIVLDKRDDQMNPPCAAVFGKPGDGCLVRVQSRCLYGEIFGSNVCDCRAQLDRAIELIRAQSGVVVYLDQEGRGAGLLAKARGYVTSQELGIDSIASYQHLGIPVDSRSYEDAAALLREIGLTRIRLLTKNTAKIDGLRLAGIKVERTGLLDDIPHEWR